MGFLSRGFDAAGVTNAFLNSYKMFSDQRKQREEDDRKKAQMAATSGFLSRLPGFKDMGDMTNVDPATAYQVYNHQEALRAKQEELNRKRQVAENTAKLYARILPQGAIPEGADLTDVDTGIFKSIYEADQKNKQQQARNQFEMEQQNRSFGQQVKLKGMPTYADAQGNSDEMGSGGVFPGKDLKSRAANIALKLQAKMDSGQELDKKEQALLVIAKSQLGETKQMNDGSIIRVSPGLSVLGGNDQQPGKQVVEQITKSDIPLSEVTKNKEKARAVAEVVDSLESLKGFVEKHGITPVKMLNPEVYGRSGSAYRTTMNVLKTAEDYGALQEGEIQNLQKIISDPTSLGSLAAGKEGAVAVYNDLIDTYTRRLDSYSDLTGGQVNGRAYLENMRARRKQQSGKYSSPIPSNTGMRPVFGGGQ